MIPREIDGPDGNLRGSGSGSSVNYHYRNPASGVVEIPERDAAAFTSRPRRVRVATGVAIDFPKTDGTDHGTTNTRSEVVRRPGGSLPLIVEVGLHRRMTVLLGTARTRTTRVWHWDAENLSVREIPGAEAPVAVRACATSDLGGPRVDVRVFEGSFLRPVGWDDLSKDDPVRRAPGDDDAATISRAVVARVLEHHGLAYSGAARSDAGRPCETPERGVVATMVSDTLPELLAFAQGWLDEFLVVVDGAVHVRSASPVVRLEDPFPFAGLGFDVDHRFPEEGIELWTCGSDAWEKAFSPFDPASRTAASGWLDGRIAVAAADVWRRARVGPLVLRLDLVDACRLAARTAPSEAEWNGVRENDVKGVSALVLPVAPLTVPEIDPVPVGGDAGRTIRIGLPWLRVRSGWSLHTSDLPHLDPDEWEEVALVGGVRRSILHRDGEYLVRAANTVGHPVTTEFLRPARLGAAPGDRMRTLAGALEAEAFRLAFPDTRRKTDVPWRVYAKAAGDRGWRTAREEDHADVFAAFCAARLVVVDDVLHLRCAEPWIEVRNTFESADVVVRWSDALLREAPGRCVLAYPLVAMDEAMTVAGAAGRIAPSNERRIEILRSDPLSTRHDLRNLAIALDAMFEIADRRVRMLPRDFVERAVEARDALAEAADAESSASEEDLAVAERWIDALSTPIMEGCVAPVHLVAAARALHGARLEAGKSSRVLDDDELYDFAM